jgi:hypothetical protein
LIVAAALCLRIVSAAVVLSGRVVDESDTPVAAARIIMRAAGGHASGVWNATANQGGFFSVSLPSEGDYQVTVQREGFFELKDRPLRIETANPSVNLVLSPLREVFQAIDVTESPSPTDVDQMQHKKTLTGTEVVDIPYPVTHSLRNAMRLLPGTVLDAKGGVHFQGATENQVQYVLNGFDIGDPITGRLRTRLSVEAVRSIDYISTRLSSEYGKGSAGVVSIRTDSGSDQFRYTATNFVPGVDFRRGMHIGDWSPRFGLSGPIWRGRAWFSDSFDAGFNQSYVNGLPKGADRKWAAAGSNLLHLQVNLTPGNILFSDVLVNHDHQSRFGLAPLDPASTTTTMRFQNIVWSLRDQLYAGGFLFETGYAENRVDDRRNPEGSDLYVISPEGRSGNYFVDSRQYATRRQIIENVAFPQREWHGTHRLRAGVDLDFLNYSAALHRTGYEQVGLSGKVLATTVFAGGGPIAVTNTQVASYVSETWQPREELTFEVGLRGDHDRLVGDTLFSPRAAVSYAPFRSRRTKISGGYARIADSSYLDLFSRPLDQYSVVTTYNPLRSAATVFRSGDRNLRLPRSDNLSFSIDQQVAARMYAGVNIVHRRLSEGLTYVNSGPMNESLDGVPIAAQFTLQNARRDAYDSIEFAIRQNVGAQFEWMASYTFSRAQSNAVYDLSVDQPLSVSSNLGRLPWDSPHRLLSWGYLPVVGVPLMRKNWAISYLLDMRTGFPFSVQDETGRVTGEVNSHRFPLNLDLNVHLEKRFVFGGYRFAVRGGINNITDQANPTAVNNVIGSPQYLRFFGYEGRHMVLRIRFFGRA